MGVAVALTVSATPVLTAGADPATSAERRIAAQLPPRLAANPTLRGHTVGRVVDADTGRIVWSSGANTASLPASTTKLATAVAALTALGASTRLTTEVRQSALRSGLVLRAGGDPELQLAHLSLLAARTATAVKAQGIKRVAIRVDDALFGQTAAAPGWRTSYFPAEVPPLRGLTYDRRYTMDTAMDTGRRFAQLLAADGVPVASVTRRPGLATTRRLAAVQGWTVAQIAQRMLNVSSNVDAEYLARLVAIRTGRGTSWDAVRAGTRSVLWHAGISLAGFDAYDGSGLSRSNRISPTMLIRLVRYAHRTPSLAAVLFAPGALPRSGIDGTLAGRYRSAPASCARGRVQAKTGTLTGAITLAGRTAGADGRAKVFALMVSGPVQADAARAGLDRLASTMTGCW